MPKTVNNKSKKGFTIIEVVLVLAIAGLIFLMVFIALPALQRSQRNTQRRDDYSMLVTAVNSYMASNNGKLGNLVKTTNPAKLDASRWVNSTGEDPNGNSYEVMAYGVDNWVNTGSKAPGGTVGQGCSIAGKNNKTECEGASGTWSENGSAGSQVFIVIQANCKGSDTNGDPMPAKDTASRAFAVYGYLEGGGYFCQDSGSNGAVSSS